ncbi:hypothetical protein [Streptomyces albipurpureus]|uniref:Uncharacterized protein n=1 Tax=Streptomyces albipurpureus TaxID=2897419 RepID=A0ABT0UQ90_9ACTN|nr:hypothetical protein [Streptomyces sp. CWNU-1]MCM2389785.1 hypothetical protein [Streptomyces sp. CWNU-1]
MTTGAGRDPAMNTAVRGHRLRSACAPVRDGANGGARPLGRRAEINGPAGSVHRAGQPAWIGAAKSAARLTR